MSKPVSVLVLVPFREHHLRQIREAAGPGSTVTQVISPVAHPLPDDELVALMDGVDVVVGEPYPSALVRTTTVRWVQQTWAGTDRYTRGPIPFPEGMRLTNVAGTAYGHIISQYVVGQVLALAQNLPTYVRQQQRAYWHDAGPVMTLEGAEVLIFGAGDLGGSTACRLASFDVRCTGVCRDVDRPREGFARLVRLDEAESLLGASDVVVNCLPNVPETVGWLDERRLWMMREGSILVNVGRGNFVDCDALADVLAQGRLRGAALDVTYPEPLPAGHPLWSEPRCVITPHRAGVAFGACTATEDRICAVTCENLRRFVAGKPLTHVVI